MTGGPIAIVFDLDDTLADTFGSVLDQAYRETVQSMVDAGLHANVLEARAALDEIRAADPTTDFARRLVERFGADAPEECAAAGRATFFGAPRDGIRLQEGAVEVLDALGMRGLRLFLLTLGDRANQDRKIDRLGIRDRFESVHVLSHESGPDKTAALAALLEDADLDPRDTWVVGDRPDGEIAAGNALDAFTVRLRAGEFRNVEASTPARRPDRTISRLPELLQLLPPPPPAPRGT